MSCYLKNARWVGRVLLFAVLGLGACQTAQPDLNEQSAAIHDEAMEVQIKVEKALAELKQISRGTSFQKALLRDSIAAVERDYARWAAIVVEVPGHDHDHHTHSHAHHESETDLTPEVMLDVQKEIKRQITAIYARAESLREQAITE